MADASANDWADFDEKSIALAVFQLKCSGGKEHRNNAESKIGRFLWLSDIHFDPYYGSNRAVGYQNADCDDRDALLQHPFGQAGCDAPSTLIDQILSKASQTVRETVGLDFVLVTGDSCRHRNNVLVPDPIQQTGAILSNVTNAL